MGKSRVFEIAYVGLKYGPHLFEYHIDYRFLQEMNYDLGEIDDLTCKVILTFDKRNNFFLLKFDIDGKALVTCDRCGDPLELNIWDEHHLTIKLTNDEALTHEEEEDVVFLSYHDTVIDVSEWIYEFILLSIPIQKLHPDDNNGNSLCNPEALQLLNRYKNDGHLSSKSDVWKDLKKLKRDNK